MSGRQTSTLTPSALHPRGPLPGKRKVSLTQLPPKCLLMALVLAGLVLAGALVAWAAYVTQTQDPMDALREETT